MRLTQQILMGFFAVLVLGTFSLNSNAQFEGGVPPILLNYMPNAVYVPPGFDNNDKVHFVYDGYFPDTCLKHGKSDVRVDLANRTIYVQNMVYYYEQQLCMEMLVHYQDTVTVGLLPAGNYNIIFEDNNLTPIPVASLRVDQANKTNLDEHLYAPVSNVIFDDLPDGGKAITIKGEFTNSCMRLKDVKILHRVSNVIEVLPIAEMPGGQCLTVAVPFSVSVRLPQSNSGRKLVHIRSLNGKSLNRIVRFN